MNNIRELELDRTSSDTLPMVEIFETVEGEGIRAGFPTVFVRVFHCNLRCSWCDTSYSYAPAQPQYYASISDIIEKVNYYAHHNLCLTGGEPLMHGQKSLKLIAELAKLEQLTDIHIETNGAIDLTPFCLLRASESIMKHKIRFVLDYKLPGSGESDRMIISNLKLLNDVDEVKFVIADENDFKIAIDILEKHHERGIPLFSPVWDKMHPDKLVSLILKYKLSHVKLNLQLHKYIWHPETRGV